MAAMQTSPHAIGESRTSRTLYTVVSLVCILILGSMLGYRSQQIKWRVLKSLSLTRILVFVLYVFAITFVSSAAVVEIGLGLSSKEACRAAVIICLTFYVGSKVTIYVFLVERAHALRAPYMRRTRDWIWVGGISVIAAGFGSIAVCGFLWPITRISPSDGRCRIGLPLRVTIPLVTYDGIINLALTVIFIYLLRPVLHFGGFSENAAQRNSFTQGIGRMLKSASRRPSVEVHHLNQTFLKSVEALLWKSLIASVLVMLPTIGNLVSLSILKGQELGWVCLTICTFDVTWAVCITHWLTMGSSDVDERALALLVQPDSASHASSTPAVSL